MEAYLIQPFLESTKNIIKQMSGVEVEAGEVIEERDDLVSYGVATVISFTGKLKGRLLLDMEPAVAVAIAAKINQEEYSSERQLMVLASISELNNIVAGDANTLLNNKYQLGLRLAPPIVFTGKDAIICVPKIPSASAHCRTGYGKLKMNIAFEGSGS